MFDNSKEIKFCQGCMNNSLNVKDPGCGNLPAASFQEKTLYPYAAQYEGKVTIKTYNCYVRDYTTPFPRELELRFPAR